MMNEPIKNNIHFRFGKWLVADITSGVAMANVMANAETSVPAFAFVIWRLEEMSVKIPTITNSLVPRTNVNKVSVKMSSQCRLVNSVVCINTSFLDECKSCHRVEKQSNYHTIKYFYKENPCIVIVDFFLLKKLLPESFPNFTVTCYVRKQKKNSKRINKEKHKGNKMLKM